MTRQVPSGRRDLQVEAVELVHETVEFVLGLAIASFLTLRDADGHADGIAPRGDELRVTLQHRLIQRIGSAKQNRQIDFEPARLAVRAAGNGG